ncbi:MAG: biopolymer transporter ExbD [Rhizobiales bacterium]|nr:biopolymer transporter ExbD [Hyphomicrobiales bacterium]
MFEDVFAVQRRKMSLTPLIDVVFILLLFFMVATSFSQHRDVSIALAGTGAASTPLTRSFVIVTVLDGTTASVNGIATTIESITLAIDAAARDAEETVVLVRTQGGTSMQDLLSVIEAARRANVHAVALVN